MRRGRRSAVWIVALALGLGACEERLPQRRVESIAELPYPSCGAEAARESTRIGQGHLRPGPTMRERNVVERFEIRRRDCFEVVTVRQEWPLGVADVEVIYDATKRPIRAWKRMTLPGVEGQEVEDIRRYELRTSPVTLKKRLPTGRIELREIRGETPIAVIGPGRGLLSMWIRAAELEVGEKVRGPVLDFRETIEQIRMVTLRRDADRFEPSYGRVVRVYTVYGRETVFADEDDIVIGDLAGLRPDALVKEPPPPALPSGRPPDPVNTP